MYSLRPPYRGISHVVVNAMHVTRALAAEAGDREPGPQTQVFACDDNHGTVTDWTDLATVHVRDHELALAALGYTVVSR